MSKIKNIFQPQILHNYDNTNDVYSLIPQIKTISLECSRLCSLLKSNPSNKFLNLSTGNYIVNDNSSKTLIFWQYLGNNLLTVKSLEKMSLSNAMVIIDDAYEGLLTQEKLEFIIRSVKKLTNHFIIVTSNYKLSGENVVVYDYHITNKNFDNIVVDKYDCKENVFNRSKKFVCLNNIPRPHRLKMVDYLLESKLDNDCYISCGIRPVLDVVDDPDNLDKLSQDVGEQVISKKINTTNLLDSNVIGYNFSPSTKKRLLDNLPIDLDIEENQRSQMRNYLPNSENFFQDAYWAIVNERDFFDQRFEGYTEKVLKCFLFKIPFLVAGLPLTLDKLKSLGFMTFGGYIDESYDKEFDNEKRFSKICTEIDKLSKLNYAELHTMRMEMSAILEYNFLHYKRLNSTMMPNRVISLILEWYYFV